MEFVDGQWKLNEERLQEGWIASSNHSTYSQITYFWMRLEPDTPKAICYYFHVGRLSPELIATRYTPIDTSTINGSAWRHFGPFYFCQGEQQDLSENCAFEWHNS